MYTLRAHPTCLLRTLGESSPEMSFLGASRDELLFVAFIVILVVAAPKIPKLGEWIGGLLSSMFSSGKPADDARRGSAEGAQGAARPPEEKPDAKTPRR